MRIKKLKIENCKIVNYKKGFTLMEALIVFFVISLLIAAAIPQFSAMRERQTLTNAGENILSALNKARSQTLASLDSSSYGVRFEPGAVIIFKGESYSAEDPDNQSMNITAPAAISNVTLGGVSSSSGELFFNRLTGAPEDAGTVTVSNSSLSKTITISATGAVSMD